MRNSGLFTLPLGQKWYSQELVRNDLFSMEVKKWHWFFQLTWQQPLFLTPPGSGRSSSNLPGLQEVKLTRRSGRLVCSHGSLSRAFSEAKMKREWNMRSQKSVSGLCFGFGRCKTMDECVFALWPSHLPWKKKKKKTRIEQICSLERYGIFVGVGQTFVAGQWPWAAEVLAFSPASFLCRW